MTIAMTHSRTLCHWLTPNVVSREGGNPLSVILILFLFSACSFNETYFEFRSFGSEWGRTSPAVFEAKIDDNSIPYNIDIKIRNDNDYAFRNIWLFIDCKTPSGAVLNDTLNVELADVFGKWYGKGFSLHCLSAPLKTNYRFPETGVYTFAIRHGMRQDPLKGISDAGLRICHN
jgi:gliding motility-associated lipoprotein GldH